MRPVCRLNCRRLPVVPTRQRLPRASSDSSGALLPSGSAVTATACALTMAQSALVGVRRSSLKCGGTDYAAPPPRLSGTPWSGRERSFASCARTQHDLNSGCIFRYLADVFQLIVEIAQVRQSATSSQTVRRKTLRQTRNLARTSTHPPLSAPDHPFGGFLRRWTAAFARTGRPRS